MLENSDRLSCLVGKEDGIILNDTIFYFKRANIEMDFQLIIVEQDSGAKCILFYKIERKSTI